MSGKIYYGLHFYPGVAKYDNASGSHLLYLNENTLRKMDKTFRGKPAFVEHVEKVEQDRNKLRNSADAWVIKSFYNEPDGKHWVEFITVTDDADNAIQAGYKLSNSYDAELNNTPGIWNGVHYDNEATDGIYEHLAITKNPRYNESIILTPEQFKEYNDKLKLELSKISNSKQPQENNMAIKDLFFKRVPIENSIDYEKTLVCLPKSKKEYSLIQIVNAMDELEEKIKNNEASNDMKVKLHDGTICKVLELVEKYKNSEEKIKKTKKEDEEDEDENVENEDDEEKEKDKMKNEDDEDEDDKEKKKMKNKKMENSLNKDKNFNELKNAHLNVQNSQEEYRMYTTQDKILRGKELF